MMIRLLGPVDVLIDGVSRPVPGTRRKAVLAALALRHGEILSTDRLIGIVWDDGTPRTAATTLRSHISHLRRTLDDRVSILARPSGYVLSGGDEVTDVQEAERLIRQAGASPDPGECEAFLKSATGLWRDRALADLTELSWFKDHAERLDALHLHAKQRLNDTRLALGRHAEIIAELETLAREHPFHEPISGQLMLALYRTGRQGEALATFNRLRQNLDEHLGIVPSPPLRDLETAILRQDPSLEGPPTPMTGPVPTAPPTGSAAPSPASPIAGVVPAQLPPAVIAFAGRSRELARLNGLLDGARSADDGLDGTCPTTPGTAIISVITGTAGVGKTTLAVHWAHRIADEFPGGTLYVNLRGYDPSGSAVDPAEALHGFLVAFGIPGERIPDSVEAKIGLYRSVLADKRVLVVLDNARDAEQVHPLLPGSSGCLAIVTSRDQLTPLLAATGAHILTMDLMSAAEARDLLALRIGSERVTAEPDATEEIISQCSRLPLALAIAAARAVTHPHFPLSTLAAELGEAGGDLGEGFHDVDSTSGIRATLSWSYRTFSSSAARLFRLLSLHPGPDIGISAAASLAGLTRTQARTSLNELVQAHMLTEHRPARYTFHDLLRAYSLEQAQTHDSSQARRKATHRLLDHYVHGADTAGRLLNAQHRVLGLAAPQPGVVLDGIDGHDDATKWCAAEHAALPALVEHAAKSGFDAHAWQLARAFRIYLHRQGLWAAQAAVQRVALDAARRLGNGTVQAQALACLAIAYSQMGRIGDALSHHRQALDLYTSLGNVTGQALVHIYLANLAERQDRPDDALRHSRQAFDLYRAIDDRTGQANALNWIGRAHSLCGDHRKALDHCRQALGELEKSGDGIGQALTWENLGHAHHDLGDHRQAIHCYQRALDKYREVGGDLRGEADTLRRFGDSLNAVGDADGARHIWRQALTALEQIGDPDAARIRTKLRGH